MFDYADFTDFPQMNTAEQYPHKDLTERIIGAAFEVHNELGGGFVENVYENALAVELRKKGLKVEQQIAVDVKYHGESVGVFVADVVVERLVLIEIKSVRTLLPEHESKLIHYLKATGTEVGLLLNFNESVQVRRKIYTAKTAKIMGRH